MNATTRAAAAAFLAILLTSVVAGVVAAHPLGNFTINHYAALRVAPEAIDLDVVVDHAEIPTFETRRTLDPDADGELTADEVHRAAVEGCATLRSDLLLTIRDAPVPLTPVAVGLTFPEGVGGLPTMRLVCQYRAIPAAPIDSPTRITFADRSRAERIGWREIVVAGDGLITEGAPALDASASARLTSYPTDLLATPLDVREVTFTARPGGAPLAPWTAPDATPLPGTVARTSPPSATSGVPPAAPVSGADATSRAQAALAATVPGGVPDEVSDLLAIRDLDLLAILGSLALAAVLGAAHALSPGHGKTVMAAYLVGSRGTTRQAALLGLSVTVSHTVGVLALALLVLSAATLVPPERLFPILIATSGVLFVLLGLWMLRGHRQQRRERLAVSTASRAADHLHHSHSGHTHEDAAHHHDPQHEHEHEHEHAHEHEHEHGRAPGHRAAPHGDAAAQPHGPVDASNDALGWHAHGGTRHRHVIPGAGIGWRSLVTLGLAGGLVPSVSALILLLGSLAAGRPAFGLVLVIAFGAGMAVVLTGIGVLLVHARGRLERSRRLSRRLPLADLPILAALVVIGAGCYVIAGALGQALI